MRTPKLPIALPIAVLIACSLAPLSLQGALSRFDPPDDLPPNLAPPVARALSAAYLKDAERKDLRVFFGAWTEPDLDTPARAARAALQAGVWDDPSFKLDATDPLDRAEAALRRGECEEALALCAPRADDEPLRSVRIRVEALASLGRSDEARALAESARDRVMKKGANSAEEITEGVRAALFISHLRREITPETLKAGAGEYHGLMTALGNAREKIDKLYWPAMLVEADVLYEKDNPAEAQKIYQQVRTYNPSAAGPITSMAQMAIDTFNFSAAERLTDLLDENAARLGAETVRGASVPAELLRARMLMRQDDAEGATAIVDRVRARLPRSREALALAAAVAARRFDFDSAEKLCAEFDTLAPNSPTALFEVGKVLADARQYGPAASFLERARERAPAWAAPAIELGLLEMQAGRIDRSLTALRVATQLDPFNVRADNSLRMASELINYARVESEHFIVRYKPAPEGAANPTTEPTDDVLAREMLVPLEEIYAVVTGKGKGGIDHHPAVKTVIDLMPDHQWFAARITGMPDIHTIAASTGSCIAMESPREGAHHLGSYDWVRVVRHEFTHTVTLSRTNNRIPHWFTEASAVNLELSPRDYSACQLLARALDTDDLFDFSQISLMFIRPRRPSDRSQAYAQGHWMYEYMITRWGERAPLDLMDQYAKGVREEAAFQAVLGVTRAEFFDQFRTWAREQTIAWGMFPRPGTPTVKELIEAASPPDEPKAADPVPSPPADVKPADPPPEPQPEPLIPGAAPKPQVEVTPELVRTWLDQYPEHPDLLELALDEEVSAAGKSITATIVSLAERYAAARPVDPKPHRLLAKAFLDGVDGAAPNTDGAIPHLEYLDAREQKSGAFAAQLARLYAGRAGAQGTTNPADDWARAGEKAERATRVAPYVAEYRELAATIALKRADAPAAERHLRALVDIEPKRAIHRQRLEAFLKLPKDRPTPQP